MTDTLREKTQSEARCRELFIANMLRRGYDNSFWNCCNSGKWDNAVWQDNWESWHPAYFAHHAALKRCVEALEYYADRGNYFVGVDQMHPTVFKPTNVDEGYRARQTLAELKEILHDR